MWGPVFTCSQGLVGVPARQHSPRLLGPGVTTCGGWTITEHGCRSLAPGTSPAVGFVQPGRLESHSVPRFGTHSATNDKNLLSQALLTPRNPQATAGVDREAAPSGLALPGILVTTRPPRLQPSRQGRRKDVAAVSFVKTKPSQPFLHPHMPPSTLPTSVWHREAGTRVSLWAGTKLPGGKGGVRWGVDGVGP